MSERTDPLPTESSMARSPGVWHKDGPLAQVRSMANWVEDAAVLGRTASRESLRKIVTNLRAAVAALEREREELRRLDLVPIQQLQTRVAELEEVLKVTKMEREWLLGAWAAASGIPQAQAEAEMLAASEKWRANALANEDVA